jgi:hypothetical protein
MTPPPLPPLPFDCAAGRGVACFFADDAFEAAGLLDRPRPLADGLVRFRALVVLLALDLLAPLVLRALALRELLRFVVPELVVAISPPGLRLRCVAAAVAQQAVSQAGSRHTGDG